ncbi:MAG: HlyD family efflux transporter periplasmic adaptor subunit [Microthrixaceae bacterium]
MLRTTSPRGWWALIVVVVIVVAAGLWSIFGWIPLQTSFTATINAEIYTMQVTAPATGTLALGDGPRLPDVTAGDVLGTVTDETGTSVPITSPVSGALTGSYGQPGERVERGEMLARILTPPEPGQRIVLVAYLPAAQLRDMPVGSSVQVVIEDPATGRSHEAEGTVAFLGSTPADEEVMSGTSLSDALVEQWIADAGGRAYSTGITVPAWDADAVGFVPMGGQIAGITRTYGEAHPLSILLGGGR